MSSHVTHYIHLFRWCCSYVPPQSGRISAAVSEAGSGGAWPHPKAAVSEHRSLLSPAAGRCVRRGCPRTAAASFVPAYPSFSAGHRAGQSEPRAAALQRRRGRIAQPARAWHRRLAPHNGTIHRHPPSLPPAQVTGAAQPGPGIQAQPLPEVRGWPLTGSGSRAPPESPLAPRLQRHAQRPRRPPPPGGVGRGGAGRCGTVTGSAYPRPPAPRAALPAAAPRSATCAPVSLLSARPDPVPPHPRLPGKGCARREGGEAGQPVHGRVRNRVSPAWEHPRGAPGRRPGAANPDLSACHMKTIITSAGGGEEKLKAVRQRSGGHWRPPPSHRPRGYKHLTG